MYHSPSMEYSLVLFVVLMISFSGCFLQNHWAMISDDLPTPLCVSVGLSVSNAQCLPLCLQACMFVYMVSRDRDSGNCYCCPQPKKGAAINGTKWKSYFLNTCPRGYLLYTCTDITSCLRYEETTANYMDATATCHLESANLLRVDSAGKFNVLKEFMMLTANVTKSQVWIQGKKSNGIWKFHDGTHFPNFFCPPILSNGPLEKRMRLKTFDDFTCHDDISQNKYGFVCEILYP